MGRSKFGSVVLFSCALGFSVPLTILGCGEADVIKEPSGAPVATATAVSFEDTAPRGSMLDGIISISRAADERSLTHYVIYWGSDAQTVVPGTQPIVSLSKVLPDLTFRITPIYGRPAGATHFLVKTKNERGEMAG